MSLKDKFPAIISKQRPSTMSQNEIGGYLEQHLNPREAPRAASLLKQFDFGSIQLLRAVVKPLADGDTKEALNVISTFFEDKNDSGFIPYLYAEAYTIPRHVFDDSEYSEYIESSYTPFLRRKICSCLNVAIGIALTQKAIDEMENHHTEEAFLDVICRQTLSEQEFTLLANCTIDEYATHFDEDISDEYRPLLHSDIKTYITSDKSTLWMQNQQTNDIMGISHVSYVFGMMDGIFSMFKFSVRPTDADFERNQSLFSMLQNMADKMVENGVDPDTGTLESQILKMLQYALNVESPDQDMINDPYKSPLFNFEGDPRYSARAFARGIIKKYNESLSKIKYPGISNDIEHNNS